MKENWPIIEVGIACFGIAIVWVIVVAIVLAFAN